MSTFIYQGLRIYACAHLSSWHCPLSFRLTTCTVRHSTFVNKHRTHHHVTLPANIYHCRCSAYTFWRVDLSACPSSASRTCTLRIPVSSFFPARFTLFTLSTLCAIPSSHSFVSLQYRSFSPAFLSLLLPSFLSSSVLIACLLLHRIFCSLSSSALLSHSFKREGE